MQVSNTGHGYTSSHDGFWGVCLIGACFVWSARQSDGNVSGLSDGAVLLSRTRISFPVLKKGQAIQVKLINFSASREGEVVRPDFQLDPQRVIEHQPLAIDKPPAHLTSVTAPNPAAVPAMPAQPASRPKQLWDNAATDSQLFTRPKPGGWMS